MGGFTVSNVYDGIHGGFMQKEKNAEEKVECGKKLSFVSYNLRWQDPFISCNYRTENEQKAEGKRFDLQIVKIYLTLVKLRTGSEPNWCALGRLVNEDQAEITCEASLGL